MKICKTENCNNITTSSGVTSAGNEVRSTYCTPCKRDRAKGGKFAYRKYKKDTCEKCGFIAQHSCQLDVDHVDGNHSDNSVGNLQTLCANCHRLKSYLNGDTCK